MWEILWANAHVAQQVEHFLGKEEVTGSSPVVGSKGIMAGYGKRVQFDASG